MKRIISWGVLFFAYSYCENSALGASAGHALSIYDAFPLMTPELLHEDLDEYNGKTPDKGITRQRYKDFSFVLRTARKIITERSLPTFSQYHDALERAHGPEMRERNLLKMRVIALFPPKGKGEATIVPISVPHYFISGFAEQYIGTGSLPPPGPERCISINPEKINFCFVSSFIAREKVVEIVRALLLSRRYQALYVQPILSMDNRLVQLEATDENSTVEKLKAAFKRYDEIEDAGEKREFKKVLDRLVGGFFAHSEQSALIYLKEKVEPEINALKETHGEPLGLIVHMTTENDMCQNCFKTMYQLSKHNIRLAGAPLFIFVTGTKAHFPHIKIQEGHELKSIGSRFHKFLISTLQGGEDTPINLENLSQLKLFVENKNSAKEDLSSSGGGSGKSG